MKRKILLMLLCVIAALGCAFGLAACGDSGNSKSKHKHSLKHLDAVASTCIKEGNIEFWYCSYCRKYFSDSNAKNEITQSSTKLRLSEHTPIADEAVEATCISTGLTEGKHCLVCHDILIEQKSILAFGHTEVTDKAVAATCTATGLTEGKHCSVCKNVLVDQEIAGMKAHKFGDDKLCSDCGMHTPSEGLEYTLSNGKASVVGIGTCEDTEIYISNSYQGYPVTSVGERAFMYCRSLESVTVPDSVTGIGNDAFYGCSSLTGITIPDSVTIISSYVFGYCSALESITIPDSVTKIGWDAFRECPIETATVPALAISHIPKGKLKTINIISGESIGKEAFKNCSTLISITIPASVTSIGDYAFANCSALTIYCENTEKPSDWVSDWNFSDCPIIWDCKNNDKDKDGYAYAIIDGLRYSLKDGIATVIGQPTNITTANIPASVTYRNASYAVTSIGSNAFKDCSSLISVTIPDSVASIGSRAFYICSLLTSITIGDGVTSIGESAFLYCRALASISFNGTKEQWKAIEKDSWWNAYTGNYTVHCTDGDLTKAESAS